MVLQRQTRAALLQLLLLAVVVVLSDLNKHSF
jgi:hypothetical protein